MILQLLQLPLNQTSTDAQTGDILALGESADGARSQDAAEGEANDVRARSIDVCVVEGSA